MFAECLSMFEMRKKYNDENICLYRFRDAKHLEQQIRNAPNNPNNAPLIRKSRQKYVDLFYNPRIWLTYKTSRFVLWNHLS